MRLIHSESAPTTAGEAALRSFLVFGPGGSAERVTRLPSGYHVEEARIDEVAPAKRKRRSPSPSLPELIDPTPPDWHRITWPVVSRGTLCPEVLFSQKDGKLVVQIGSSWMSFDHHGAIKFAADVMIRVPKAPAP